MSARFVLRCAWAIGVLAAPWASAAELDTRLVASGLSQPVYATAPLNDGRVFVVEKTGAIKVAQGGAISTFLSVPVNSSGEQGLLGLAFDPGYANPASPGFRRFFVNYIDPSTQDTVVASYRTSAGNASLADPASRTEVLRVDQPAGLNNHKAGWMAFRPGDSNDLYIAVGDGGSGNDPFNNGQNRNTLLGKMLRVDINRDDFADTNLNYGIPASNPFVGVAGTRGEVYAYGLRNPWRNSFDRLSGDLWIGDVGQSAREEVDRVTVAAGGGQNFGWRGREGRIATPGISDAPVSGLTEPWLDYDHSFGQAITGGYVVREAGSPLYGRYVFADYVTGRIWSIASDPAAKNIGDATDITSLLRAGAGGNLGNISSFGEGANGELFIVDLSGKVVQVVPEPASVWLMLGGALCLAVRYRSQQRRVGYASRSDLERADDVVPNPLHWFVGMGHRGGRS